MVGLGFVLGLIGYGVVRWAYYDYKNNRKSTAETIAMGCLAVFVFGLSLGLVLVGLQLIDVNLIDVNFVSSNSTNQTVNTISYLFK